MQSGVDTDDLELCERLGSGDYSLLNAALKQYQSAASGKRNVTPSLQFASCPFWKVSSPP